MREARAPQAQGSACVKVWGNGGAPSGSVGPLGRYQKGMSQHDAGEARGGPRSGAEGSGEPRQGFKPGAAQPSLCSGKSTLVVLWWVGAGGCDWGRKPCEERRVKARGEPQILPEEELLGWRGGTPQRQNPQDSKTDAGVWSQSASPPEVLGLGRRTGEQQMRCGSEQPSVQGWVRALWPEMTGGSRTPSVSSGQASQTESPQLGLVQQRKATCLPALAVCLHCVSRVLILELLEGQVGIGVQGQAGGGGLDLALPRRAGPGEAGPLPRAGDRHLLSCFSQRMLRG